MNTAESLNALVKNGYAVIINLNYDIEARPYSTKSKL